MTHPEHIEPVEGFIESQGVRIHYLDYGGAGPPAHLLHGNGFCAGAYAPFVRFLVHRLRVIASDIRGHGDSVQPELEPIRHWKVFADDLKALMEAAMPVPVVGIGHSLGAVATYMAAAAYPALFSALVLIDPVILPWRRLLPIALRKLLGMSGKDPRARRARQRRKVFKDKQEAFRLFTAGRGPFKSWSPEFVEAYLECGLWEKDKQTAVLRCDPELEARIFESIPTDVWTYARKIRCPVLTIRGEQSEIFLPDAARRLGRLLADSEQTTISGTGHFVPMEKPAECAEAIAGFVERIGSF
jgi:pimeloyl-ACP methyl ester carboxylesterase